MLAGWDLIAAVVVALVVATCSPRWVPASLCKDLYLLGTSVLSIIFSVYIAALAIVISSADDAFVKFLEEDGSFSDLLWGFETTLVLLFLALVFSVVAYSLTSVQIARDLPLQHLSGIVVFVFLFAYSLGATLASTLTSITYARRRAAFLKAVNPIGQRPQSRS